MSTLRVTDANIQAVKDLIALYRSLKQEDFVDDGDDTIREQLRVLTGFGSCTDCLVCKSVNSHCNLCIHVILNQSYCDYRCYFQSTYERLVDSTYYNVISRLEDRCVFLENMLKRYYELQSTMEIS